jgi:hypothetical protein
VKARPVPALGRTLAGSPVHFDATPTPDRRLSASELAAIEQRLEQPAARRSIVEFLGSLLDHEPR